STVGHQARSHRRPAVTARRFCTLPIAMSRVASVQTTATPGKKYIHARAETIAYVPASAQAMTSRSGHEEGLDRSNHHTATTENATNAETISPKPNQKLYQVL